ncbi:MAG: hypothetical protein ACD_75C01209G0001, partial [uncultured bacterium]
QLGVIHVFIGLRRSIEEFHYPSSNYYKENSWYFFDKPRIIYFRSISLPFAADSQMCFLTRSNETLAVVTVLRPKIRKDTSQNSCRARMMAGFHSLSMPLMISGSI